MENELREKLKDCTIQELIDIIDMGIRLNNIVKAVDDFIEAKDLDEIISSNNNGGSTDYYKLPTKAKDLQDLIEHKQMNFAQGNIFKAIYRANEEHHSTYERDLNKIIWFANREILRIKGK